MRRAGAMLHCCNELLEVGAGALQSHAGARRRAFSGPSDLKHDFLFGWLLQFRAVTSRRDRCEFGILGRERRDPFEEALNSLVALATATHLR